MPPPSTNPNVCSNDCAFAARNGGIDPAPVSGDDAHRNAHCLGRHSMHKTSWDQIEPEKMNDLITRQMVNGENATVSRLLLSRGAVVPRHSHVSEQYSLIFAGNLKFIFDDREVEVKAGEVLYIPANVPHSAVAMEDTVDLDFFAPRREDWIRKEDSYLRQGKT
jgi:unsaturated pyranuronate lyase